MRTRTDKQWIEWVRSFYRHPWYARQRALLASGVEHVDALLRLVSQSFGEGRQRASALDFGFGACRVLAPLAQHFPHVTGVDISAPMLELAAKRVLQATLARTLDELPRRRFEVGGVFALHVTVRDSRPWRRALNFARNRLPPLQWAYNAVRSRRLGQPVAEMPRYDFGKLLSILRRRYAGALVMQDHDHGG